VNTQDLRDLLQDRASDVDSVSSDRVAQVRGRVRAARRNRVLAGVAVAALVAVGVALGATTPGDDTRTDVPAKEGPPDARTYDVVPTLLTRLTPGSWGLSAIGFDSAPLAVVEVPRGFYGGGAALFDKQSSDTAMSQDPAAVDGPQFRWISLWTPTGVYKNPCTDQGGRWHVDSVAGMADALARQRTSSTTHAVPVTVDGHEGLYVELTAPPELDIASCKDGAYDVFESDPGTRWMNTPGMVDHYWIVEVDGRVLMLVTSTGPGVSAARAAELAGIVRTARFEPQAGTSP
jgi:hypothetical protein